MGVTANQALPYPENTDPPNVPLDIQELALATETKLNMRFADAAARDAAVTAPVTGMNCYIDATKEYQLYSNAMWNTIWTGDFTSTVPRMSSLLSYQNRAGRPASTREGVLGLDRTRSVVESYSGAGWKQAGASAVGNYQFTSFAGSPNSSLFASAGGSTNNQFSGTAFSLGNATTTSVMLSYTMQMYAITNTAGQNCAITTYLQYQAPGSGTWVNVTPSLITQFIPTLPVAYNVYFGASATCAISLTGAGNYNLRLFMSHAAVAGPTCYIDRITMIASPMVSSAVFS